MLKRYLEKLKKTNALLETKRYWNTEDDERVWKGRDPQPTRGSVWVAL